MMRLHFQKVRIRKSTQRRDYSNRIPIQNGANCALATIRPTINKPLPFSYCRDCFQSMTNTLIFVTKLQISVT